MTKNQISYHQLAEDRRHNQAMESETNRSNLAKEQENVRTNTENERIKRQANNVANRGHELKYYGTKYRADMSALASAVSALIGGAAKVGSAS